MQNVPPMKFRKSDRFFVGQIRESVVSPAARQKYRRDDDERKDNEKWQIVFIGFHARVRADVTL
jgi:hypothetical protein